VEVVKGMLLGSSAVFDIPTAAVATELWRSRAHRTPRCVYLPRVGVSVCAGQICWCVLLVVFRHLRAISLVVVCRPPFVMLFARFHASSTCLCMSFYLMSIGSKHRAVARQISTDGASWEIEDSLVQWDLVLMSSQPKTWHLKLIQFFEQSKDLHKDNKLSCYVFCIRSSNVVCWSGSKRSLAIAGRWGHWRAPSQVKVRSGGNGAERTTKTTTGPRNRRQSATPAHTHRGYIQQFLQLKSPTSMQPA
jgi:hypothetical protein